MKYCIMKTLIPTEDIASKIAQTLVENKLAACVNSISCVNSVYRWKDKVCKKEEIILLIKTKDTLFDVIKEKIIELHPYELPEVTMFYIDKASSEFLEWIDKETI